jgi:hypothetical protein
MGALSGEEAYQELLALDRQELHRDVRATLLSTLYSHLERDEAWYILEREARSADKTIALSTVRMSIGHALGKARNRSAISHLFRFAEWNTLTIIRLSGEHLSLKAQQRLMRLFTTLLEHPEIDVRAAALRGCIRLPGADEGQALLSRLLATMASDDEEICGTTANALFGTCVASDAPLIRHAIQQLLPQRRALLTIVQVLAKELPANRRQILPVVRAMIEALAVDPLTIGLRIQLAIISLPWDEVATMLENAAAAEELHADALKQACNRLNRVVGRYGSSGRPDIKEMVRLEERLATSHDERLRRVALAALVVHTEAEKDWNESRRARLQIYRADSSLLVAAAAQFTLLPQRED